MSDKTLNKMAIFAANDSKTERVHIPEWDGWVIVRTMSGTDRDRWEQAMVTEAQAKLGVIRGHALMAIYSVVDEEGNFLFEESDAELLGKKSSAALARIYRVARRLSKLNAGAVEEAAKN